MMFARILCFRDKKVEEVVDETKGVVDKGAESKRDAEEEEDELDDDDEVKEPDKNGVGVRRETNEREEEMMAQSKGVTAQAKMESPVRPTHSHRRRQTSVLNS
jgi:hypothetical protein